MHRANRCYKQLPASPVCQQHQYLLHCDGLSGTKDQGAQKLHLLARVGLLCPLLLWSFDSSSRKHFFEKRDKGTNAPSEFKASVKVHTLTVLPNHHFSFVDCFPLVFLLQSFPPNGSSAPRNRIAASSLVASLPPWADRTGSKCPGEASLTHGRVSLQLLWKNERTQIYHSSSLQRGELQTLPEISSPQTSSVLLANMFRWSLSILERKGNKTPWFFFPAIPHLKRIPDQDAGRSPGWPSLHFLPKDEWAPETIRQTMEELRAVLLQKSQGWASFLHWDRSWCFWQGHCLMRKDINVWNFTMDSEFKGKRAKKKKSPYRQQALEI